MALRIGNVHRTVQRADGDVVSVRHSRHAAANKIKRSVNIRTGKNGTKFPKFLLESDHGFDGTVGHDAPDQIEVSDVHGTVRGRSQRDRSQKPLLRPAVAVTVRAVQRPLVPVAHGRQYDPGLLFQIDVRAVALLQDALVEVVPVVYVQVPRADLRNAHVVPAEFGRLHVPHDVPAVGVLVADLHQSGGDAVHVLPVHVQPVPRVRVLDDRVGLERFLEQYPLDRDPQMDQFQGGRDGVGRQLKLNRGQVAGRPGAVVHQVQSGPGNLEALLHDLRTTKPLYYVL